MAGCSRIARRRIPCSGERWAYDVQIQGTDAVDMEVLGNRSIPNGDAFWHHRGAGMRPPLWVAWGIHGGQ